MNADVYSEITESGIASEREKRVCISELRKSCLLEPKWKIIILCITELSLVSEDFALTDIRGSFQWWCARISHTNLSCAVV